MDLALLVYAISLLDGFRVFFGLIITLSLMTMIASGIFVCSWKFDSTEYSWNLNRDGTIKEKVLAGRRLGEKLFKYSIIISAIAGFFNIMMPSERTAYIMVGAYATQMVSENEKVQATGKKVISLIEQKLDSYIEDGLKEVSKPKKGKKDE